MSLQGSGKGPSWCEHVPVTIPCEVFRTKSLEWIADRPGLIQPFCSLVDNFRSESYSALCDDTRCTQTFHFHSYFSPPKNDLPLKCQKPFQSETLQPNLFAERSFGRTISAHNDVSFSLNPPVISHLLIEEIHQSWKRGISSSKIDSDQSFLYYK